MRYIAAIFVVLAALPAWSAEGMWTLDNPPLQAMQKDIGWAPTSQWLDQAMRGSARIAGGCSASFVSKNGLVLTNHHCVARCAEQLSNAKQDFLQAGFVTHQAADERRCAAMEVNRLEKISDVTGDIKRATEGLNGTAFKTAQNAAKAKLTSACVGTEGSKVRCDVIDLYHGGQYKLYRYHRFQDVRLVFAPEQAAAFFGGDPDNFNFPRYDLDMSLVRVYEDDKPAQVANYFPLNAQGPAADEPVFVVGHPGSTDRGLTLAQLSLLRDQLVLDTVLRLAEYRGVLTAYSTTGAEANRTAAGELFGVENSYKALRGRLSTLLDPVLFTRKQADETALRKYVASQPKLAKEIGGAWDAIAQAEKIHRDLSRPLSQIEGGLGFNSQYFQIARTLVRGAAERVKANAERLPEFNDNVIPQVEATLFSNAPIYPELEKVKLTFALTKLREVLGTDVSLVQRVLGKQSPEQLATRLISSTRLGDPATRRRLWDGGAAAIASSDDPFIRLAVDIDPDARALRTRYEREVEAVVQKNTEAIAKARFALAGDTTYPDATFTLRLSYGVVKGWEEAGQQITPFTQFDGAFARATGAAPFALPASWIANKDKLTLTTPLNFVTTNDIIGGNSGSPVLNRKGELVGLIFDGNIHSLGGAYTYDPTLNRSVAVDSAAILEALDKIYDAKSLVNELSGN
ncbi:MAG: peptidase family protein [Verrucomicrobiaceae bacterium]|nr:peptidase family protein [Verrucomicrobiaceae bacterium]